MNYRDDQMPVIQFSINHGRTVEQKRELLKILTKVTAIVTAIIFRKSQKNDDDENGNEEQPDDSEDNENNG